MKILCIDDDALNRRVLGSMLAVAGVETVEAADGAAGLALVEKAELDAVIVDLRMPDLDGAEVARRIRARTDAHAAMPVVIVTADMGPHVLSDCLAAGADGVLHKPVVMTTLFDMLGKAFARRARG